jgi:C1A family cysteine protease
MFGFKVYNSYAQAATTGKIPMPVSADKVVGGHAIVAVGYDDTVKIKNTNPGGVETTGAILFRNSWEPGWGNAGYGWLPYEYVLRILAIDWWAIVKSGWFNSSNFKKSFAICRPGKE